MPVKAKIQFMGYRIATVLKSLKTLYCLPQDKVDSFIASYDVYNHDWANEEELIAKMGKNYYAEVKRKIIDWYSVLNHLCTIGQVEKMYIPPAMDLSKSIIANQVLFEEKMAKDLNIKQGDQVLDIGCGRGRVAHHVASITGANVTGMNIDPDQLDSAKRFAEGRGLSDQCQFKMADVNDIPFPFKDNSLDAIYQIQVFSLSKDLEKLFKELHRILKPGGRISCLDWMQLDAFDPKNPHHADLMKKIKPLIGAIGTHSVQNYIAPMKKAGFDIVISQNASIDGLQAPLIESADKFFTRAYRLVQFLVKWRLLPKHFKTLFDRFTQDGEAMVEADRMRLVTMTYHIVAQKK